MKRLLTAFILIPIVLAIIFLGPYWLFVAVVAIVAMLCFDEYNNLVAAHGITPPGRLILLAGLVLLAMPPNSPWPAITVWAAFALILAMRQQELSRVLPQASAALLGLAYIFGAWACGIGLYRLSRHWFFFALAMNWVGDSAAYYVGRAIGRHKLAPHISPGKTWEGAIGSLAFVMAVGTPYLAHFAAVPPLRGVWICLLVNAAGQIGDLAESALKRGANLKDSGTLLPGHGGWLDRLDSSLFSMPATYAITLLLGYRAYPLLP